MFKHFKPHKLTAQPASCWAGFANHLRNTAALNFLAWPQTRRKQRLAASVSQVVPHHAIFMTWMLPKAGGCYWREQTCWVNQVAVPEFLPNISSGLILTGLCGQDVLCSDGAGIGTSLRWNLCQGVPPSQPPAFSNLSNIRLQHRKEPLILVFLLFCSTGKMGHLVTHNLPTKKATQQPKKGPCAMAKKRDQYSHTCRHTSIWGAEHRASNCWRRKSHIPHDTVGTRVSKRFGHMVAQCLQYCLVTI